VATAALAAAPAVPTAPAMYQFPKEKVPAYAWPNVPVANIPFDESLLAQGDAERGRQIYSSNACIGCHMVKGNRMSAGVIGPNLTHFGSRYTFGGGLFRTEPAVLARWIKNARAMKPGVLMNTLGKDQYDPVAKMTVTAGGLDDRQIADIVAYLMALK
ncbi:MAG: c-type cytochrome, partial [Gemmatimonadaceae bacterium]|nr:c-type cytochrome [Gemmatimonadaceae bacterium]